MQHSNLYIRSLYSPDVAGLTLSFYKTNLALSFVPFLRRDKRGLSEYDKRKYVSTTIGVESAAALYYLAKRIVEGTLKDPALYVIPCNKEATLTFEHDGEKTSLLIEKKNERIPFVFMVHQYKTKENGTVVTKTIPAGLLAFMESLEAYLTAIAADRQQCGTVEELYADPKPQASVSGW